MKNVLVIGGMGYIGSHTVVELCAAGFNPVILDNLSNSDQSVLDGIKQITGTNVPFYRADFANSAAVADVLQKESIDSVIHFAAFKAVAESVADPLKYYVNNVAGFVGLLQTLHTAGIKTFVFSSSAAVYGNPPVAEVTEDTDTMPESPYGQTKLMDEIILHDYCTANPDVGGTALRYFNVVGSHSSALIGELPKGAPQNLLPIIVEAVAGKRPPLTVYGNDYDTPDGTCLRDYIHVVDLAKAHVAALQPFSGFRAYNVGTGIPTSVLELINTFAQVNKIAVPHVIGVRRPGDPVACYANANKIQQELGWKPTKTTQDAVGDAWRWYTAHAQPKT